jgi:hypothetical protein
MLRELSLTLHDTRTQRPNAPVLQTHPGDVVVPFPIFNVCRQNGGKTFDDLARPPPSSDR